MHSLEHGEQQSVSVEQSLAHLQSLSELLKRDIPLIRSMMDDLKEGIAEKTFTPEQSQPILEALASAHDLWAAYTTYMRSLGEALGHSVPEQSGGSLKRMTPSLQTAPFFIEQLDDVQKSLEEDAQIILELAAELRKTETQSDTRHTRLESAAARAQDLWQSYVSFSRGLSDSFKVLDVAHPPTNVDIFEILNTEARKSRDTFKVKIEERFDDVRELLADTHYPLERRWYLVKDHLADIQQIVTKELERIRTSLNPSDEQYCRLAVKESAGRVKEFIRSDVFSALSQVNPAHLAEHMNNSAYLSQEDADMLSASIREIQTWMWAIGQEAVSSPEQRDRSTTKMSRWRE